MLFGLLVVSGFRGASPRHDRFSRPYDDDLPHPYDARFLNILLALACSLICSFVHKYLLVKQRKRCFHGVGWGLVAFERMPLASGEPDPVRTPGAPAGPAFGSCNAGSLLEPLFGCVI